MQHFLALFFMARKDRKGLGRCQENSAENIVQYSLWASMQS